jgi:predicted NUDIX family NTP pyrophosphohydrolase
VSNICTIEWPPRSGKMMEIPEIDLGAWFTFDDAHQRILKSQQPFLERLAGLVEASSRG